MTIITIKGVVSEELRGKIVSEKNVDVLETWIQLVARVESVEQFQEEM